MALKASPPTASPFLPKQRDLLSNEPQWNVADATFSVEPRKPYSAKDPHTRRSCSSANSRETRKTRRENRLSDRQEGFSLNAWKRQE